MDDRGNIIFSIMIFGIILGFVGIFVNVFALANKDVGLFIVGLLLWTGFAVPMILSKSKKVDEWEYKEFN